MKASLQGRPNNSKKSSTNLSHLPQLIPINTKNLTVNEIRKTNKAQKNSKFCDSIIAVILKVGEDYRYLNVQTLQLGIELHHCPRGLKKNSMVICNKKEKKRKPLM